MLSFLLTLAASFCVGLLFKKLKVPGALLVGSIAGAAILCIGFDAAYMPPTAKLASQIVAGAFIACTVEKDDLLRLRYIGKPLLVMMSGFLTVNIVIGFITYWLTPLDLITSLMSCTPGGISDIPIISADLGADSAKVAAMQFIRLVAGLSIIPPMTGWMAKRKPHLTQSGLKAAQGEQSPERVRTVVKAEASSINILLTLTLAALCGILGKLSGMPAGTLTFSLIGVLVFKFVCNRAAIPRWIKSVAQVLAGAYIGSSMTRSDILEMRFLIVPALLLVAGYIINCLLCGYLMHRLFGLDIREGMLACTPAGASDMALISSDLGVQSTDLVVLQILRLLIVIIFFPPLLVGIAHLLG